ncbi:TetR/AcrR family transcriptional regulator [Thalassotalea piscium]
MAKATKYDRNEVVDKATKLYWKNGFHATSMRNLQDEIDMRPGSIYAAFGSKEGLFKETLKNYTELAITELEQCRQAHDSVIDALKVFIKAQVIDTQDDAPNGMCMLAKTVAELTEDNQELLDIAKACLGEIANKFVSLLKEAQTLGEIDKDKNAEELAIHIQIQIAGLRTFAKINNDKHLLNTKIEDIFTHYPF